MSLPKFILSTKMEIKYFSVQEFVLHFLVKAQVVTIPRVLYGLGRL